MNFEVKNLEHIHSNTRVNYKENSGPEWKGGWMDGWMDGWAKSRFKDNYYLQQSKRLNL